MAYLGFEFDATQVEPSKPFELIPAGDYKCIIIESDMVDTSKGGKMLKLTLQIIDGEHSGRLLWDQLNIFNASPVAQRIAREMLSSICHAVGIFKLDDVSILHNRPLVAAVKIRPEQGQYGPQNEIKGYKPVAQQSATAQQPTQQPFQQPEQQAAPTQAASQPAQQPAQAPAGTPPWMAGKAA